LSILASIEAHGKKQNRPKF